jgi:arginine exporter protein ArgO
MSIYALLSSGSLDSMLPIGTLHARLYSMNTIFYIFGCTLCGLVWLAAMSLLFTIIGWIFS